MRGKRPAEKCFVTVTGFDDTMSDRTCLVPAKIVNKTEEGVVVDLEVLTKNKYQSM